MCSNKRRFLRVGDTEPGQYVLTRDFSESAMRNQVDMFKQEKITQIQPCRTRSICSNKRRLLRFSHMEPGQYMFKQEKITQIKPCGTRSIYVQTKDFSESAVRNQVNIFKQEKITQIHPCGTRSIRSNKRRFLRFSHAEPGQYMFKQKISQNQPCGTRSIYSNMRRLLRFIHVEPGQYVQTREDFSDSALRNQVNMFKQETITHIQPYRIRLKYLNKKRLLRVGHAEPCQQLYGQDTTNRRICLRFKM